MADLATQESRNIFDILRGRRKQGTPTDATPDELISDAELEAIPEDAVDDGMVPILGQYNPPEEAQSFNPMGATQGDRYATREDFQATPDDRAAAGEGSADVTGQIISQGEAPETAFAEQEDPFADAWWNKADDIEAPTVDSAVAEAMFDYKVPSEWAGAGRYNYRFVPEEGGTIGTIYATDAATGETVEITPFTRGGAKAPEVGGAWKAIMDERFKTGGQPMHAVSAPAPAEQPDLQTDEFGNPLDSESPTQEAPPEAAPPEAAPTQEAPPEEAPVEGTPPLESLAGRSTLRRSSLGRGIAGVGEWIGGLGGTQANPSLETYAESEDIYDPVSEFDQVGESY